LATVYHYDAQGGGIEAANKEDKQGLGIDKRTKKRFAAQQVLGQLGRLAHNLIVWARQWLVAEMPFTVVSFQGSRSSVGAEEAGIPYDPALVVDTKYGPDEQRTLDRAQEALNDPSLDFTAVLCINDRSKPRVALNSRLGRSSDGR